mmetsp:Transcript_6647/g.16376  ORF Transcript_6647/g.16376 Transcript_6647/m.16376 type:complete len:455 (-) Transcript_6647:3068-4432(-)
MLPRVSGALALDKRQVLRHEGTVRYFLEDVEVVTEGVAHEDVVIAQEHLRVTSPNGDGALRDHEELRKRPRHPLTQLVRRVEADLKPRIFALMLEAPRRVPTVRDLEDVAQCRIVHGLERRAAHHDAGPGGVHVRAEMLGHLVETQLVGQVDELDGIAESAHVGELGMVQVPAIDGMGGERGVVGRGVLEGGVVQQGRLVARCPLLDGVRVRRILHGGDHVSRMGHFQRPVREIINREVILMNPPEALIADHNVRLHDRHVVRIAILARDGKDNVPDVRIRIAPSLLHQELYQGGVRLAIADAVSAVGARLDLPSGSQSELARRRLRGVVHVPEGQVDDRVHVLIRDVMQRGDVIVIELHGKVGRAHGAAGRVHLAEGAPVLVQEGAGSVRAPRCLAGGEPHHAAAVGNGSIGCVLFQLQSGIVLQPASVGKEAEDGPVALLRDVVEVPAEVVP